MAAGGAGVGVTGGIIGGAGSGGGVLGPVEQPATTAAMQAQKNVPRRFPFAVLKVGVGVMDVVSSIARAYCGWILHQPGHWV